MSAIPCDTLSDHPPATLAADLIIPARNERETITLLLEQLPRDQFRRVVVVDNASTDDTASLARQAGVDVVYEAQTGYGAACLAGIAHLASQSPPHVVAFLDADLADDPANLPDLITPIVDDQADLTIGSRPRLADVDSLTLPQRVGNEVACRLIFALTDQRYTDLGPMRAIRWTSLQQLKMADRTWGWTVEMQFKAAAHGLRVCETDVPYRPRHAGRSKISGSVSVSIRAGFKIIYTIAQLWWQTREVRKKTIG